MLVATSAHLELPIRIFRFFVQARWVCACQPSYLRDGEEWLVAFALSPVRGKRRLVTLRLLGDCSISMCGVPYSSCLPVFYSLFRASHTPCYVFGRARGCFCPYRLIELAGMLFSGSHVPSLQEEQYQRTQYCIPFWALAVVEYTVSSEFAVLRGFCFGLNGQRVRRDLV